MTEASNKAPRATACGALFDEAEGYFCLLRSCVEGERGDPDCAVAFVESGQQSTRHSTRYRATAGSFHSIPQPGRSSGTAHPSTIRSGFLMMGLNHSAYSAQWAVGVTHSKWC
jgi:hypothetical protein